VRTAQTDTASTAAAATATAQTGTPVPVSRVGLGMTAVCRLAHQIATAMATASTMCATATGVRRRGV